MFRWNRKETKNVTIAITRLNSTMFRWNELRTRGEEYLTISKSLNSTMFRWNMGKGGGTMRGKTFLFKFHYVQMEQIQ